MSEQVDKNILALLDSEMVKDWVYNLVTNKIKENIEKITSSSSTSNGPLKPINSKKTTENNEDEKQNDEKFPIQHSENNTDDFVYFDSEDDPLSFTISKDELLSSLVNEEDDSKCNDKTTESNEDEEQNDFSSFLNIDGSIIVNDSDVKVVEVKEQDVKDYDDSDTRDVEAKEQDVKDHDDFDLSTLEDFTYLDQRDSQFGTRETMIEFGKRYHQDVLDDLKLLATSVIKSLKIYNDKAEYIQYMQYQHGKFDGVSIIRQDYDTSIISLTPVSKCVVPIQKSVSYAKNFFNRIQERDQLEMYDRKKSKWIITEIINIWGDFIEYKKNDRYETKSRTNFFQMIINGTIKKYLLLTRD